MWNTFSHKGNREGSREMTYNPDPINQNEVEEVTEKLQQHTSPPIGHNTNVGGIAAERLKAFVERIERLQEEQKGLQDDIKDIFLEAKGTGFDVKILREILKIRKQDEQERREKKELVELYALALGMDVD
jgi:uncharacterized protein (UPF0335 family)